MEPVPGSRSSLHAAALATLQQQIRAWGNELGFDAVGFSRADPGTATAHLKRWLAAGHHGDMDYMARHAALRADPSQLLPATVSVITARMTYWPAARPAGEVLADGTLGYVSRYALGRDYHKLLRARLQTLSERIADGIKAMDADATPSTPGQRVCVDSAPVFEVEFAQQAGIGWRGKHTLLLGRGGSWHFLGEIYTTLPLLPDAPVAEHCGSCSRCLTACPTGAITAPYTVDARRCISYLTIELKGTIPEPLRPLLGNRIYGCDDCQLVCPWNRFAQLTREMDFQVRMQLDATPLTDLFAWTAAEFDTRLAGSAIRRIGHERWLRNIAVALGNAPTSAAVTAALNARANDPSALVREHVAWALEQHASRRAP